MFAHLDPIAYVVRIFEDGKGYGDKFLLSLTVIKTDDETFKIEGADKLVTPSMWRALDKAFSEAGFKYYVFDRIREDGSRKHSIHKLRGIKMANEKDMATFSISMKLEGMKDNIGDREIDFELSMDPADIEAANQLWYVHMALIFGDGDETKGIAKIKAMAQEMS